ASAGPSSSVRDRGASGTMGASSSTWADTGRRAASPAPPNRPFTVEYILGLDAADADEVLGQALRLAASPTDLLGVQFTGGRRQREGPRDRLRQSAGRDRVGRCLMRTVEYDAVVLSDHPE